MRFVGLSPNLKSFFATGTYDMVLSLGTGQAKYRAALRAFAIYVCLSVTDFVAAQTEESAEAIVFSAALDDVAREHSEEDHDEQRDRQKIVR